MAEKGYKDGEKIGSRKGNSVFLEDILKEAIQKVEKIIDEKNPGLEDKEEVAKKFDKYDLYALPVVDNENRLVGIVTVDDAINVLHDEVEEDFEKMAAMQPTEDGYFET